LNKKSQRAGNTSKKLSSEFGEANCKEEINNVGRIVPEHISAKTLEQFRQRLLLPEELLIFDDHVAECEVCRAQMGGALESGSSTNLLAALEAEPFEHPIYEQLAAYVDGQWDDLESELIESHFVCCTQCSKELRDLQALKARMTSTLAAPVVGMPQAQRLTLWEQLVAFISTFRVPLQLGAAAACLALIVWAATIPMRNNIAQLKAQLAQSEQRNDELQREYEIAKADGGDLQRQVAQLQSANPPSQESVAIALNDGRLKVDAQGAIAGLDGLSATNQQIVKSAIDSGQVKTPSSISSLTGRAGVLMGGANEGVAFALTSPIGTAVSSTRPTFRWQGLQGATGYIVTVLDMDFNVINKSPLVTSTSWAMSESLERGRVYVWKVTAMKDGKEVKSPVPPAPEARFKVLERDRVDEVLKTKRDYPDSHLLSGLAYAQAGLLDDAERAFQLLAHENPKSDVARKLLRNVKALRGR